MALHLERARLAGDYEDYRRARALLEARPVAARAVPHCLAQARLDFALHRLKAASAALASCPAGTDAAQAAAIRADIAFHSGRYGEAETTYRALVNETGTPQDFARLAFLRARTGSPAEAAALLEAAEKRYHGTSATMKAWLKLQRGLVALDRGRLDEALALYRLASDALPGWWLVDEHIAEATALAGDARGAKALYEGLSAGARSPEILDALAALEEADGRAKEAKRIRAEARTLHEERLAQFPEAAAGHALAHFLQDPGEAPRALALARANFDARPQGESAIGLARAWMLSGSPARAAELIEAQLALGWDTAEAHWVLAEARARMGREAGAAEARSQALRRNPRSESMYRVFP